MCRLNNLFRFITVFIGVMTILPGRSASVMAADKPAIFVQMGHSSEINSVDISSDGKRILSASYDKSIKLWDAESGRLIRTFMDNESVDFVRFLAGGKSFVSVNHAGSIVVWNLETAERIREFALGETRFSNLNSAVSFNGTVIHANVDLKLYAADISTGTISSFPKLPDSAPAKSYFGGSGSGFINLFTADGKRMLSSVREDSTESMSDSKYKKLIFWDTTTGNIISTLVGHRDLIRAVAFSPDEKFAASGGRDKSVRVWDLYRGKAIAVLSGHQNEIEAVAFSPDQRYLLSGSADKTMKLWDIKAQKEIRTFSHDAPVTFVRFTRDGRFAISGDDGGALHIWDITTGREVKTLKSHAIYASAMDLSPDGNQLLTGASDGEIRLWNARSGLLQKSIPAYNKPISILKFTPDGKYALSACTNKPLKLWDLRKGKLLKTFSGHSGYVNSVAISPNGLYALSSQWNKEVRLWDLKRGSLIKAFNFPGNIYSIGFTDDSRHLVIAGDDNKGNNVKVLTLGGKKIKQYDVVLAKYSNNARYVLAKSCKRKLDREEKLFDAKQKKAYRREDSFNTDMLVDLADGKVLGRFGQSGPVVHLSTSSVKDLILTKNYSDKEIVLWNVRTGKEIRRFPVKFGDLSPDGKKIIAPVDRTLRIFDADTGRVLSTFRDKASGDICSFALSVKGGYAMTGDTAGAIEFWDLAAGKLIKTIIEPPKKDIFYDRSAIAAVAFSPDNQYAAALSIGGTCKIWSLRDGHKVFELKIDFPPVYKDEWDAGNYESFGTGIIAFSPDGRYLASGTKLWNIPSGRKALDFQVPMGPGPWVAFSPDGKYLLSRHSLWDVSTGRRIKAYESINGASKSIFSKDGKFIYAVDDKGAFFVADSQTGKLVRKFTNSVSASSFDVTPDKKMMVSAETDTDILSLWDLPSGKKRAAIDINQNIKNVLAGNDSRKAFLSGISVKEIDLAKEKEIAQFISFPDGEWIVITPEGYYNASANGDKYLNVRVGNNVYGIENYREAFYRPDLVKVALSGGSLKTYRNLADVKPPPTVSIIDTPKSVDTDNVTVRLRLADNAGGIGDIRLYLNGTAVVMDSRGIAVAGEANILYKEYSLKLTSGRNIIKAVAFNADNSMQSNEAIQEVTASFTVAEKPSLSALVIGINQFKNPMLTLKYPAADADLFSTTLKKVSKGLFSSVHIRKLTTPIETTRQAIVQALKSYRSLRPDDLFVFYIASHGTVDDGEYFLITSNVGSVRTKRLKTDAISQNMLKEAVANIPATKKLILIDTCDAGALGKAIQAAMLTRGMSEVTALKILSRAVGSTILSASTSTQEALEGYKGHGLFTYVLSEGLKGKADTGKTGIVKTTQLADYVDNEVPVLAEKVFKRAQYPTISISGQSFPIGVVR